MEIHGNYRRVTCHKTPLDTRNPSAMLNLLIIFLEAAARNMKMHPPLFRHCAEIEADMFFQIGLN